MIFRKGDRNGAGIYPDCESSLDVDLVVDRNTFAVRATPLAVSPFFFVDGALRQPVNAKIDAKHAKPGSRAMRYYPSPILTGRGGLPVARRRPSDGAGLGRLDRRVPEGSPR